MAKLRPAGGKKRADKSARSAIPCGILIIMAIVLFSLLFYAALKSSF